MTSTQEELERHRQVTPYGQKDVDKKAQVAGMFDAISPTYDKLNHLLSFGIDVLWRRKLVGYLRKHKPKTLLDVATGTADVALACARGIPDVQVIGVDISNGMLQFGRQKVMAAHLDRSIRLDLGDSEQLPYETGSFDAVTASFGVRNFENLTVGLLEMHRVLAPGGVLAILEFSQPRLAPVRWVYNLYFKQILPGVGRLVSQDKSAYSYLPTSVGTFPSGEAFTSILTSVGFRNAQARPLTFGISTLYTATK